MFNITIIMFTHSLSTAHSQPKKYLPIVLRHVVDDDTCQLNGTDTRRRIRSKHPMAIMNVTTLWGLLYSFLYNNNKKKDCVIIFDETLLSLDAFLYKKKQQKWIGLKIIFWNGTNQNWWKYQTWKKRKISVIRNNRKTTDYQMEITIFFRERERERERERAY